MLRVGAPASAQSEGIVMAENKGKPSGRSLTNKKDNKESQSSGRKKSGSGGNRGLHPGGDGGPLQNAGGPDHHGGNAHEDRNP